MNLSNTACMLLKKTFFVEILESEKERATPTNTLLVMILNCC